MNNHSSALNSHLNQEDRQSQQYHSTTVPNIRLNGSSIDNILKSSFNSVSMSYRSTKSSIYSQSSKLQKSSVFRKVVQNNQVDNITKKLQQKQSELQCLKNTKDVLEQKLQNLKKQIKDQSNDGIEQSKKIRKILNKLYN